jgi:hypothetical protein
MKRTRRSSRRNRTTTTGWSTFQPPEAAALASTTKASPTIKDYGKIFVGGLPSDGTKNVCLFLSFFLSVILRCFIEYQNGLIMFDSSPCLQIIQ